MNTRSFMQAALYIAAGILLGAVLFNRTGTPVTNNTTVAEEPSVALAAVASVWYPVAKVVDGDTLAISTGGKSVTVRLIGLDTPEAVDPRKPVQCFGKEASEKAKEMLAGKTVQLEADPSQGTVDKYGRTLAYVYLPDGTLFNEYMISEGYGHEYTYNLPYKYQSEFKTAERNAREQKKGLWADGACSKNVATPVRSLRQAQDKQAQGVALNSSFSNNTYDCTQNTYNCTSFKTQVEAQYIFELCGGNSNDVHKLDSDKDGRVCESLP